MEFDTATKESDKAAHELDPWAVQAEAILNASAEETAAFVAKRIAAESKDDDPSMWFQETPEYKKALRDLGRRLFKESQERNRRIAAGEDPFQPLEAVL